MSTNGASPEILEADIARRREELAATLDELHHRLDVKAQAREKVAHVKDRATTETGRPRPELVVAICAATAAVLGLTIWRRSHR
jgi:hypothetical protein